MSTNQEQAVADDKIILMDFATALFRRWRLIAGGIALTVLISAAVATQIPNRYQATAKIMVMRREQIGMIGTAHSDASKSADLISRMSSWYPTEMPVLQGILESEALRRAIITKFGLDKKFGSIERADRHVRESVKIRQDKKGFIRVDVEDTDPRLAASIANAYIVELGKTAYKMQLVISEQIDGDRATNLSADTTTMIKLMEPATPPIQKTGPKRALIVTLATIAASIALVCLAFLLEALERMRKNDPPHWNEIKSAFKKSSL